MRAQVPGRTARLAHFARSRHSPTRFHALGSRYLLRPQKVYLDERSENSPLFSLIYPDVRNCLYNASHTLENFLWFPYPILRYGLNRLSSAQVLRMIYPAFGVGNQSVAVLAAREASALLTVLQPGTPLVLVGWSLGGAACLEAAGRLLTTPLDAVDAETSRAAVRPRVCGVITLASQAAGLLKLGNARGRINSVRASCRLLGYANTPIVCLHGALDDCVRPNQTELIADWWACPDNVTKVVLPADDHGVASCMSHIRSALDTMLPPV